MVLKSTFSNGITHTHAFAEIPVTESREVDRDMFTKEHIGKIVEICEKMDPTTLIRKLDRVDYVTSKLDEQDLDRYNNVIPHLTQGIDLETVFVCGGYAVFLAGLTTAYGDIDFFCTSKFTFDELIKRLHTKTDKSPTVVAGSCQGYSVNIVHCVDATSAEDILDSFDMTWCRAAIDLEERSIILHPRVDSEFPIFDAERLYNPHITRDALTERIFERYCKYKTRRTKLCNVSDNVVYDALLGHIQIVDPAQNSQKKFDNSY